jgi:hypothetical protein
MDMGVYKAGKKCAAVTVDDAVGRLASWLVLDRGNTIVFDHDIDGSDVIAARIVEEAGSVQHGPDHATWNSRSGD